MTSDTHDDHLERVIAAACRLTGANPALGRLSVIAGRRLTYRELVHLRCLATDHGVDLAMDGTGQVTLRRAAAPADDRGCRRGIDARPTDGC